MDSRTLAKAFDFVRQNHIPIHSLLIVKNGYVILDAYFYPFRKGQMHDGASMTKSITSSLIGIAIRNGKLIGLHQPVLSIFPNRHIANLDARKTGMTIEHLLTMSSGLECHAEDSEVTLRQMRQSPNWVQYMLDQPMASDPGSKFVYCSGGMHLLSGILSQTTGESALQFAQTNLFKPLGIAGSDWPSDSQGVSTGWGDLHLKPEDWAKIGYLWLNNGVWDGRQILPASWVKDATEVHSHPGGDDKGYGYGFWIYPKRSPMEYEALGRGGQRVTVTPDANRILVCTGGGFEPGDIGKFVGEAIKSERPIPEDPVGQAVLLKKIREAAEAPTPGDHHRAKASTLWKAVSGKTYDVDWNLLGLKSLAITFLDKNKANVRLAYGDGKVELRELGLNGVPRISPGGKFGLPVALSGEWTDKSTFAFDYDEVANINSYRFKLIFNGYKVRGEITERTGLVTADFHGRMISQ
jgi:CubicO group peptidase (beta-lactamase class C family)